MWYVSDGSDDVIGWSSARHDSEWQVLRDLFAVGAGRTIAAMKKCMEAFKDTTMRDRSVSHLVPWRFLRFSGGARRKCRWIRVIFLVDNFLTQKVERIVAI